MTDEELAEEYFESECLHSYADTEEYRQFYLPDNLEDVDPEDVIAWCEIPTFDKE